MKVRHKLEVIKNILKDSKEPNIVIMRGLRRVGKTTILKQLKDYLGDKAIYVDGRHSNSYNTIKDALGCYSRITYILVDEITSIEIYEDVVKELLYACDNFNKKVVITGSSAIHLKNIGYTLLGGGRSRKVSVPLLTFTEYLYFTGKINSYNIEDILKIYKPKAQDFKDYLLSKNISDGIAFSLDKSYLRELNKEIEIATENGTYTDSNVKFDNDVVNVVASLIAYTLNNLVTYKTLINPNIGLREKRSMDKSAVFSTDGDSKSKLKESVDAYKIIRNNNEGVLIDAIEFMLYNDIAYVEAMYGDITLTLDTIRSMIKDIKNKDMSIVNFLSSVNISLCNPTMYMNIGTDILEVNGIDKDVATKALTDDSRVMGEVYETYIKGSYANKGYGKILSSAKIRSNDREIDLFDEGEKLLCELTIGNKKLSSTYLVDCLSELRPATRVLSTNIDAPLIQSDTNSGVVRVNYLILCILVDLGIFPKYIRDNY